MASSHVHSSSSSYSSDEDDSDASHGDNEDYILQKRKVLNSNNEPEAKRSKGNPLWFLLVLFFSCFILLYKKTLLQSIWAEQIACW